MVCHLTYKTTVTIHEISACIVWLWNNIKVHTENNLLAVLFRFYELMLIPSRSWCEKVSDYFSPLDPRIGERKPYLFIHPLYSRHIHRIWVLTASSHFLSSSCPTRQAATKDIRKACDIYVGVMTYLFKIPFSAQHLNKYVKNRTWFNVKTGLIRLVLLNSVCVAGFVLNRKKQLSCNTLTQKNR